MLTKTHSILSLNPPAWLELDAAELRAASIFIVFALLFAAEALRGYRKDPARTTRKSFLANLGTFLLNDTLMSLMSVSSLLLLAEHYGGFGLLRRIPDPLWQIALSFLLYDLVLYAWHRANHRFDSLWIFHKVHHSDPTMNVSTAFRLHFVEVVLTTLVKAAFVVATGIESAMLLANEALITLLFMFHHANLRFKGERLLGGLIVTPYLHRCHHSTLRQEHDSNYGAVFSFWDRLFGSFAEQEPKTIGLYAVPNLNMWQLVRYGLICDWTPQVALAQKPRSHPQTSLERMIAEAAYYRAEKRGFEPGNDHLDWLEAEREIRSRFTKG